jgi:hypothetical protein
VSQTYFQDKSPSERVTEKLESSTKLERRRTAEDDTHHTKKTLKRVSRVLCDSFLVQVHVIKLWKFRPVIN